MFISSQTPRPALEPTVTYSVGGIWAFPFRRKQLHREADFCPLSGSIHSPIHDLVRRDKSAALRLRHVSCLAMR